MGWKICCYAGMDKKCSENRVKIQNDPDDLEKWCKMTVLSRKRPVPFRKNVVVQHGQVEIVAVRQKILT